MRRITYAIVSLWLVAPEAGAHAQGPADDRVTTDSIVALVVDPAEYLGHDAIPLFEDRRLTVEADGKSAFTIRQVVQIFNPQGAQEWGELQYSYDPERQTQRLNWATVTRTDGTVVSTEPAHRQESAFSVEPGSAVYTDSKLVQLTLSGVGPGTIVDYSFTREHISPHLPGDRWYEWHLTSFTPVRRSRFVLDVPEGLSLDIKQESLDAAPTESRRDGRKIRTWEARDIEGVELQSYAALPEDFIRSVRVAGRFTWDEIGAWYHALMPDRTAIPEELAAAHDAQVAGARTRRDSIAATYRWVAQDFRYVSLSLGLGAYRPRAPGEVFASGFGDCKDKTTLFVSLLERLGVEAHPVLVHSMGGVDRETPSLKQFDHMIARIENEGGDPSYADLTTNLTPYGQIPPDFEGEVAVVVGPQGRTEIVVLPQSETGSNRLDQVVAGSIGPDNRFVGSITWTATGTEQYGWRNDFFDSDRMTESDRDEMLRGYLSGSVWESSVMDSSSVFVGRDLDDPVRMKIWFTVDDVMGRRGAEYSLAIPLLDFVDASTVTALEAEGERRFPIDVAIVNSPAIHESRFELELPEGWVAELPASTSVSGPFGDYDAEYAQDGRMLTMRRAMGGLRGVQPPDSIGALISWFETVVADDAKSITITGPATVAASESGSGPLTEMLLGIEDLPEGAVLASETPELGDDFFAGFSGSEHIHALTRLFAAEQMVFTVGETFLVGLQLSAGAFESRRVVQRDLAVLQLLDLSVAFEAILDGLGVDQASIGETRDLDLDGVGDGGTGWILEVITPLATFDMGLATFSNGRVAVSATAMGVAGMREEDLIGLFETVSERIEADESYLKDLEGDDAADEADEISWSVADSVGVALDEVFLDPDDFTDAVEGTRSFSREDDDDTVEYSESIEADVFTFETLSSEAMWLDMTIVRHEVAEMALKAHLASEAREDGHLISTYMDLEEDTEDPEFDAALNDAFMGGDVLEVRRLEASGIGSRAFGVAAEFKGAFAMDTEVIEFVHGRYRVSLMVTRTPGTDGADDSIEMARLLSENLLRVVPEVVATEHDASVIERIEEVMSAELELNRMFDERALDMDAVFRVIEDSRIAESPVDFERRTWNRVCWWGALRGHAERVLSMCERSIHPENPGLGYVDSRAIARALAGDREGAIEDLAYIAERARNGSFRDTRGAWLEALRAGEDPFTPEELARLRGDEVP